MSEKFGARLRQLRLEKNLTQGELGEILNTGKSSISHYENNTRYPDINIMALYASYFDVSVDYIMGKTDNRKNNVITINSPDFLENVIPQSISVDSDTKALFKNRLISIIVSKELTKTLLSKRSKIDKGLLNKYIDGELMPDIKNLKKLAKALNTTVDYLLGLNDNPSPDEMVLLEDWVKVKEGNETKKIPANLLREFLKSVDKDNDDE